MKQTAPSKGQSRRWNSILRLSLLALAGLILGLRIYSWNTESLVGDQLPMPLGFGVSVVLTGSMEPELSADDLVVICESDGEVAVDDIVVFQDGHTLVIHRVIAIDGDTVITKGDANNLQDDPIQRKDIKGVLVFSIPYIGALVRLLKHPVTVAILLIAALWLANRSFRKEKTKDTDELDEIKKEIERLKNEAQK